MRKSTHTLFCTLVLALFVQVAACDSGDGKKDADKDVAPTADNQVEPATDATADVPTETPDVAPVEDVQPVEEVAGELPAPPADVVVTPDVPPVEDVKPVEDVPPVEDIQEPAPPTLNNGHSGWKKPKCFNCQADDHNNELDPSQCTDCHGTNGAPKGHGKSTCAGCHNNPHGATGFPTPESCKTCHP